VSGYWPLWPEYLAFFVFGAMIGSFLNVVICRLPNDESLVHPGSHCPQCNRPIRPWENIPILSFLFLRGKCAGCGKSISWQYPLVEAVTGGLFMLMLWHSGWSVSLALYEPVDAWIALGTLIPMLALSALLVALSGIDLMTMRLPNVLTLTGAIMAIVLTLIFKPHDWLRMVLGGGLGIGMLGMMGIIGRLLFRKETLGLGDVKLAGMMGLFLGPATTAGMYFFGIFSGAIIGGGLLLISKGGWSQKIPFGPYLAAGGIIASIWGEPVWRWYVAFATR